MGSTKLNKETLCCLFSSTSQSRRIWSTTNYQWHDRHLWPWTDKFNNYAIGKSILYLNHLLKLMNLEYSPDLRIFVDPRLPRVPRFLSPLFLLYFFFFFSLFLVFFLTLRKRPRTPACQNNRNDVVVDSLKSLFIVPVTCRSLWTE